MTIWVIYLIRKKRNISRLSAYFIRSILPAFLMWSLLLLTSCGFENYKTTHILNGTISTPPFSINTAQPTYAMTGEVNVSPGKIDIHIVGTSKHPSKTVISCSGTSTKVYSPTMFLVPLACSDHIGARLIIYLDTSDFPSGHGTLLRDDGSIGVFEFGRDVLVGKPL